MINVYDLHFKKDILPLFDHLYNEHSRTALLELLLDVPASVDEIYVRQNILKAFLANSQLYAPFSYSRVEFSQVYGYIEEKKTKNDHLSTGALKMHLLFSRSESNWEKGNLYQLFYFLYKIHQFYFARLNLASFPRDFSVRIENMQRMLSDLEVEKYYNIGRKQGFSNSAAALLIHRIGEKIVHGEMDLFWKDFFVFEAYFSLAKGIKENDFTFPLFVDNRISIDGFYHPSLKFPVKNSLEVKDAVTLITGPNMSGKSTLLRSIGLCVYLSHLGLGVPAAKCELPFFDVISIAINLNDDMTSGYSHFMKEIQTLKQVVVSAHAKKRCFAIFDELFRGTNIEDALAISSTTILGLTSFSSSFFFISTHLHQLEKIAASRAVNACCIECRLEKGLPIFTYKLKTGWSDLKIGQIIFRQEGLDELLTQKVSGDLN
jgi:DNA mismatch repair protein MutS